MNRFVFSCQSFTFNFNQKNRNESSSEWSMHWAFKEDVHWNWSDDNSYESDEHILDRSSPRSILMSNWFQLKVLNRARETALVKHLVTMIRYFVVEIFMKTEGIDMWIDLGNFHRRYLYLSFSYDLEWLSIFLTKNDLFIERKLRWILPTLVMHIQENLSILKSEPLFHWPSDGLTTILTPYSDSAYCQNREKNSLEKNDFEKPFLWSNPQDNWWWGCDSVPKTQNFWASRFLQQWSDSASNLTSDRLLSIGERLSRTTYEDDFRTVKYPHQILSQDNTYDVKIYSHFSPSYQQMFY